MFIKITDEKGIPIDDSNPLAVRFIGLDASGTFNVNVVEPQLPEVNADGSVNTKITSMPDAKLTTSGGAPGSMTAPLYTTERVARIIGNGKIDITGTSEQSLQVDGKTMYIQNTGTNKFFMDVNTGVTSDKWEIVPGRIAGPMSASGTMYFRGEGATTLKYIFVE